MGLAEDNQFPSILLAEQGSAPTTPAAGFGRIYIKTDGVYFVDDDGAVVGPFATAGSSLTRTQLGTTSIGASFDTTLKTVVKKITVASAGLLASINIGLKGDTTNTANLTAMLLTDSAGTPSLVRASGNPQRGHSSSSTLDSAIFINATARFIAIPVGVWLAAADYWIGAVVDGTSGNGAQIAYAAGTGTDRTSTQTDAARDYSITTLTAGTNDYSIYADFLT